MVIEWIVASGALLGGAGASMRWAWWRRPLDGFPVLMYRHIGSALSTTPAGENRVSTGTFAKHLDHLVAKGYQAVTLSQVLSPQRPPKPVVLTFDNGYADFFSQAWPLLKERDMTANIFVVSRALDGVDGWDLRGDSPPEPMLTRFQLKELSAAGVEIGGHSHTHRELIRLDGRDLMREVTGCQKALSDILDQPVRTFSYPYGKLNRRVVEAVQRAGFTAACTVRPGMITTESNSLLLPRIVIKGSDRLMDFKLKLSRTKSTL